MGKKSKPNKTVSEWMKDANNYKHGLYLVPIRKERIPVSNQLCTICKKGWNASLGLWSVRNNKVYHTECLKKRGLIDKNVISE